MREGDWQEGATAFLRVTALEPESGDAWNNLAACYIRMEKNTEALHALEQALRLNRENWRMWENYLLLSVTMREGARVLMAMKILCNMQKFDLFTPKVFEAINVYG
jgi:Flp pilus assembly protein TadD